ncbi:MAG: phosphoribosyl-ATP diphosphatase [Gammaproteobacteria bacterium]|nr:phosphoribosyl-ATP diphosphatase [Gammaproteobacteria bacterium]
MDSGQLLQALEAVLDARKGGDPDASYVAGLYARGLDTILKKVGEEATEVVIAAKGGERGEVIYELADLWFHTLVLMRHLDLGSADVMAELERRFGLSGIEEKAKRGVKNGE